MLLITSVLVFGLLATRRLASGFVEDSMLITASGHKDEALDVETRAPTTWPREVDNEIKSEDTVERKETAIRYASLPGDDQIERQASLLASKSLEVRLNKLQTLLEVSKQLEQLKNETKLTLGNLSLIYDRIADIATSSEPISALEASTVSRIMELARELTGRMSIKQWRMCEGHNLSLGGDVLVCRTANPRHDYSEEGRYHLFDDNADGFVIDSTGNSNNYNKKFGVIVYQKNVSPFRTPPAIGTPLTRYRVVDLLTGVHRADGFQTVSFSWEYETPTGNAKYGCAIWDDVAGNWTSLTCAVVNAPVLLLWKAVFHVSCYCDLAFNGNTSEYIMYQFEAEVESTIRIDNVTMQGANLTNTEKQYSYYQGLMTDLAKNVTKPDLLNALLSEYLNYVMTFDNVFLTKPSGDKILEDIGTILAAVQPDEGRHTIGQRNEVLSSFITQSQSANARDLPVGFGVYNDVTSGIECFMVAEEVDPNLLFSSQMNFSLLFSRSVTRQNSRYAFLLYPPDKFFRPATFIDGKRVLHMRVVDIVLTPSTEDIEDQLVHMYFGLSTMEYLYNCAYWSASLSGWTTKGCYRNPGIYLGVCTCTMSVNFEESRRRGQYILFNYSSTKRYDIESESKEVERNEANDRLTLEAFFRVTKYQLHRKSVQTLPQLIADVSEIFCRHTNDRLYYRLADSARETLIKTTRNAAMGSDRCRNFHQKIGFEQIIVICSENRPEMLKKSFNKLAFNIRLTNIVAIGDSTYLQVYNPATYKATASHWADNVFALRVSESVLTQNSRHAFLLYPHDAYIRPPPSTGHFFSSRVVDVVLAPRLPVRQEAQYVEFTFTKPAGHVFGCGVWDELDGDWTSRGCQVVHIASVEVCNCSLVADGGEFIVYSYSDVELDQEVFTQFNSEAFTNATAIFDVGATLIHNASLLSTDKRMLKDVIYAYDKMLFHMDDLPDTQLKMMPVLKSLETLFQWLLEDGEINSTTFDFPGERSVKTAELADDLFSNSVLSSSEKNDLNPGSDMAFVEIGGMSKTDLFYGLKYSRGDAKKVQLVDDADSLAVYKANPPFACFFTKSSLLFYGRVIFLVYPLNASPYKLSMETGPVFNSRQVDIFYQANIILQDRLELYFQPTEHPKDYINTACAVWDEAAQDWTSDLCELNYVMEHVSCVCNATKRSPSRMIIYEYTDQPNFVLSDFVPRTGAVYLIGSALSLIGLIMVAMTAILFADWREELSNKILVHLATSNLLYLTLTMFRETHTIYADMKHLDVTLVAFTVSVHYTRLVHHCWGLVMSALQYKRFSGVVGASTISHLLLKVCVFAWGVPLLPLAVLLSWDVREHFCTPDKLTHYVLYLVPVVVITLLNIGLLVAIVRVITNGCGMWNDEELQRHGGSNRDVIMRQLKQTVMMFFLFGIPAVFEMFNDLVFHSVVMVYINKLLDPIQGFVMFVFFVVINDKTRGMWNARVFGDVTAVKQSTKHIMFKPKRTKKAATVRVGKSVSLKENDAEHASPEVEILAAIEPEGGLVVRYVVQGHDGACLLGEEVVTEPVKGDNSVGAFVEVSQGTTSTSNTQLSLEDS